MENGKSPAFPAMDMNYSEDRGNQLQLRYEGLTKREYFAALAMQGLLANARNADIHRVNDWGINGQQIVNNAVHVADELLKELENKEDGR